MRKNIKVLLTNILKYAIVPVAVTWVVCVVSFNKDKDSNPQPPTILKDCDDMDFHDPLDDADDSYLSDTSRIADSAFVIYDRKYEITTLFIEGLLDKKGIDACERLIVDKEQIDHIVVSCWSFRPEFINQTKKLTDYMATMRNKNFEETNAFMFIR